MTELRFPSRLMPIPSTPRVPFRTRVLVRFLRRPRLRLKLLPRRLMPLTLRLTLLLMLLLMLRLRLMLPVLRPLPPVLRPLPPKVRLLLLKMRLMPLLKMLPRLRRRNPRLRRLLMLRLLLQMVPLMPLPIPRILRWDQPRCWKSSSHSWLALMVCRMRRQSKR